MCGIVGLVSKRNKEMEISLVDMLKKLEYRGYDSCGIAVNDRKKLSATKTSGSIDNLKKIVQATGKSTIGIAHTRWATHGSPTEENAHPFISMNKSWSIVHNGIIENYEKLKADLGNKGYIFQSDTDSEVIAQMLDNNNDYSIDNMISVCKNFTGSYAIAGINKKKPRTLYLAKKSSPLYVARNNFEVIASSDPVCFADRVDRYYTLEDNEFCEAGLDEIKFYDITGKLIKKEAKAIDEIILEDGLGDYPHYMLKEIMEEKDVLERIADVYLEKNPFKFLDKNFVEKYNKIVFIGCGTAYHAGLMGASFVRSLSKIDSECYIASEYPNLSPIITDKTLFVFVSQSGETADTMNVCNFVKNLGATTIALTNVLYSTLAKSVDFVIPVCAGREVAVASTKAYTAQIAVLYMFAKHLNNVKSLSNSSLLSSNPKEEILSLRLDDENKNIPDYISDIRKLSVSESLDRWGDIEEIVEKIKDSNNVFFIGRGLDYITATEASLKLKEITYINSSSYPAGELKHGFLALVDESSYVFVLLSDKNLAEKTLNNAYEVKSRGGKIILVSTIEIDEKKSQIADFHIKLQGEDKYLSAITLVNFFQMLAYLVSVAKGLNPDKPRNLAKSVTVE